MRAVRILAFFLAPAILFGCSGALSNTPPLPNSPATASGKPGTQDSASSVWREVSVEKGRVTVSMPGTPAKSKQTVAGATGPIVSLIHKTQSGPMAFNFTFVTYTDATIKGHGGPSPLLENLATTMMIQRAGSQQDSLDPIQEAGCPAIAHSYHFPAGPAGSYPAGYASQRLYLIGNQLCWLLIEVTGSAEDNRAADLADIRRFFDSLRISGLPPLP